MGNNTYGILLHIFSEENKTMLVTMCKWADTNNMNEYSASSLSDSITSTETYHDDEHMNDESSCASDHIDKINNMESGDK